jgi:hypothetical protein
MFIFVKMKWMHFFIPTLKSNHKYSAAFDKLSNEYGQDEFDLEDAQVALYYA